MRDIRKSPEYQRWKREVRQRDGDACRICGVHLNLHIHHIKPLEKYPDFATEFDNGITLCGNCHALLRGKEESTNLQTIIEAVTKKPDRRIANQLKELNDKFCAYLEPLLKSSDPNIRNNAFYQLFVQLQIYPDLLDQFLPLIQHLLDSENGPDEGLAKQIAIEFLKGNSSGAASQILSEYERRIEAERRRGEAEAEELKQLPLLAEQGDAGAQFRLGWRYAIGEGVLQDYAEAVMWYRKAAKQGYANAQNHLGWMYRNGRGVEQDYVEAVKWFQKAAEQGEAYAQNDPGFMYDKDKDVEQDYVDVVMWYRKAAKQGYANAQNHLGWMYRNGRGVEQDDAEAVMWYRKAAEQGHLDSQNSLGWIYEYGKGVEQDYVEAVKWYHKAAQQGYANAQNNLGWMYQIGRGVEPDGSEAVKWYRRAAEQGNTAAQNKLAKR